PDWLACQDLTKTVDERDQIVLGFDGSRGRNRGVPDATALIGCRVSDGHLFEIRVWEQPPGPAGRVGGAIRVEVDAGVGEALRRCGVVGVCGDASGWSRQVAGWEAKFRHRVRVKATQSAPIAGWPRGRDSRVTEYLSRFHDAVMHQE